MDEDRYHAAFLALLQNMSYLLHEDSVDIILGRENAGFANDADLEDFIEYAVDRFAESSELL